MADAGEPYWIPWADRLLIGVVTATICLVLFPIVLASSVSLAWGDRLPAAACAASTIALAGYVPALLAHYRFGPRPSRKWIWFGSPPEQFRQAGKPAEKVIVVVFTVLGLAAAAGSLTLTG